MKELKFLLRAFISKPNRKGLFAFIILFQFFLGFLKYSMETGCVYFAPVMIVVLPYFFLSTIVKVKDDVEFYLVLINVLLLIYILVIPISIARTMGGKCPFLLYLVSASFGFYVASGYIKEIADMIISFKHYLNEQTKKSKEKKKE